MYFNSIGKKYEDIFTEENKIAFILHTCVECFFVLLLHVAIEKKLYNIFILPKYACAVNMHYTLCQWLPCLIVAVKKYMSVIFS